MAYSLRSHRASIAAGVLTFALVAPAVTVVDSPFVAVAQAQEAGVFNDRYDTENFWGKPEAKVTGLSLDPGTTVAATTNTIFNWRFRNDNGALVLIRPQSATAFKTGSQDIRVRVTPAGGAAYTTTLKVNVVDVDEDKEAAQQALQEQVDGWKSQRFPVDFKDSKVKNVDGAAVPATAAVSKRGIGKAGWSVANNNGTISVTAPSNYTGASNEDIPITITDKGATVETTLQLAATGPEKPASTPGAGLGGFLGNVVGGLLGGGGGNGGLFSDLVHVEVHPSAVVATGNGVIQSGAVSDNGKVNVEPSAVVISDNGKVNVEPSAVVISDNAKVELEPGAISENGKINVEPSAVVISDNAKVEPSAVVVSENLKDNGVIHPGGISENLKDNGVLHPGAISENLKENGKVEPGAFTGNGVLQPGAISGNGVLQPGAISGNGVAQPGAVQVKDNANVHPDAVGVDVNARMEEGAVQVTDNGIVQAGAVAPNLGSSSGRTGGAALEGGLDDPRCIASLVGISLPVAALVPLALAQGLSLPGLEALSAIAAGAFNDAARQFGIDPALLTAVGGGLVGAALAALVGVAVATCPPRAVAIETDDTPTDANSTAGTSNGVATVVAEATEPVTV